MGTVYATQSDLTALAVPSAALTGISSGTINQALASASATACRKGRSIRCSKFFRRALDAAADEL